MKKQKEYLRLTLVISILVAMILPLSISGKPIEWGSFFHLMTSGFTLVWAIYVIVLFINVFLIEGRRLNKKSKKKGETDPFTSRLIEEWQALWEITVKRKDWDQKKRLWS